MSPADEVLMVDGQPITAAGRWRHQIRAVVPLAAGLALVGCSMPPAADIGGPPRVTAPPIASPFVSIDPVTNAISVHARLTSKRRAQQAVEGQYPTAVPLLFEFVVLSPDGEQTSTGTVQVDQATFDAYHSGDWLKLHCPAAGICKVLSS